MSGPNAAVPTRTATSEKPSMAGQKLGSRMARLMPEK